MRSPARKLAAGGLVIAAALAFLVYQGISNNLVYYITPSELMAKGAAADGQSLRLGGQVRPGSVDFNTSTEELRFILQDPKAAIAVVSRGIPPEMFKAGIGVVVEGTYTGRLFAATNLMIKHGASYRAPKPGQTPVPDGYVSDPSK
jgi:cytochrome c-type biogenesis protein CcmE